jgi:hypothetical protein
VTQPVYIMQPGYAPGYAPRPVHYPPGQYPPGQFPPDHHHHHH